MSVVAVGAPGQNGSMWNGGYVVLFRQQELAQTAPRPAALAARIRISNVSPRGELRNRAVADPSGGRGEQQRCAAPNRRGLEQAVIVVAAHVGSAYDTRRVNAATASPGL